MSKRWLVALIAVLAFVGGYLVATEKPAVQGQQEGETVAALGAVADEIGAMDPFGPYQVAANWPKDISTLPGNEKWTWGAGQGVFAESPNRVIVLQRGELPVLPAIRETTLPQIAAGLTFPIRGLMRNATSASPPGALEVNGRVGDDSDVGKAGVDFLWENCIVIVDRDGNIVETWKQWDKMLRRPHSVYISPYDPQKNVWVVDDYRHAIFKFTNDGKQLLQTLGEPNVHASDEEHFYRPTFMAFHPDGTFYVSDGYANTRVVKFDKDGKYLTSWGEKGDNGKETRPGYFNSVHGVALDPQTNQVYVNDRNNRRVQVFDENGRFLRMWTLKWDLASVHILHIDADRRLWLFDQSSQKLLQYDLEGRLKYAWGGLGSYAGALFGPHGLSVDQEQNLYLAAVGRGGVQKFIPKPGANPNYLVGKNLYSAWK